MEPNGEVGMVGFLKTKAGMGGASSLITFPPRHLAAARHGT